MSRWSDRQGFTLVELVVTIVVIGIALGGILLVMNFTTAHSADPMIRQQAVAIAESYLEEILLRAYDEDAVPLTTDTEGGWGPDSLEGARADFDDVNDYAGLGPQAPADQEGNPIATLASFTVEVQVQSTTLNTVPAARVTVRVRHPDGTDLTLTGYRTPY